LERKFTAKQLAKLPSGFILELPKPAKSAEKIKVTVLIPKLGSGVKGLQSIINFKDFTYSSEGPRSIIRLNIDKARKLTGASTQPITFKINFVPKPASSKLKIQ